MSDTLIQQVGEFPLSNEDLCAAREMCRFGVDFKVDSASEICEVLGICTEKLSFIQAHFEAAQLLVSLSLNGRD